MSYLVEGQDFYGVWSWENVVASGGKQVATYKEEWQAINACWDLAVLFARHSGKTAEEQRTRLRVVPQND